jgi:hypothetical protein
MTGEKRAQNGQRLLYYRSYPLAVQIVDTQATASIEPCLAPIEERVAKVMYI